MPRRRQRFAALERQFRESGGQAAAGSRLAGYIDFKTGKTSIKVSRVLTAEQRKRFGYAILPFGLSVSATPSPSERYAAAITAYSNSGRRDLGLSDNECGYDNIGEETTQDDNFYPALIRCFIPSGTTVETPTSAITRKEYRRRPGRSISFPFGRTVTSVVDAKTGEAESTLNNVDQLDVRKGLAQKAKNGNGTNKALSVSFEPEAFKVGKPDLASPAAQQNP
ncbi:hypothetical protein [Gloeocapsopsis sp. IPPAS B-1203]|uniref:hypothetical protein n=1 Tax=Gloeocapsopsis sp. IPPAS B-1203 TaxID=2049454 RepID=UPI000C1941FF|nr:hypothetical protein [Gloeocapsopsis sp. IPPAS B-1203]PIG94587.1 hypothetical protein CSQ79_04735 [Gloeocapsopsis sp. IPPAS B-1203]